MPDSDLHIADWLSQHNHEEKKDEEIANMKLSFSTIDTQSKHHCMHNNARHPKGNTK